MSQCQTPKSRLSCAIPLEIRSKVRAINARTNKAFRKSPEYCVTNNTQLNTLSRPLSAPPNLRLFPALPPTPWSTWNHAHYRHKLDFILNTFYSQKMIGEFVMELINVHAAKLRGFRDSAGGRWVSTLPGTEGRWSSRREALDKSVKKNTTVE